MAFLEWRRFTFFDIHKNVDNGKIAEALQDTHVTVATSGNNHVVLCDVTGWVHLISRSWEITTFKAYELTVSLAQQLPHDPYLVTIGDEEAGVNPLIKVWDWSRSDRHGNPICVRVSRAVPSHMRSTPTTALAVHDNKNLLAVGFQDGSVSLFRGDISRQRSGKMKTLSDSGTSPITGLAFKGADKLFVVSRSCIMVYWLGADRCVTLDAMGAAPGCSVLADKHRLTVANNDAIYCYTTEGRGPCYALEGEKVRLNWFRSYLVITTNESPPKASTSSAPAPKSHHITILDIQNKFIVFSKTFDEIDAVLTEWGSFHILTKKKEMIYLDEKDLQSKLSLLFKILCTDYKPRGSLLVDEASLSGAVTTREPEHALPDDYVHMFLNNSERLIEFLEHMINSDNRCSKLIYNALIEHYIHVWAKSDDSVKAEYEQRVLKILRDPEANYDKDQTLVICQMLGFHAGILYLYEENKLWRAQVALYMRHDDAESALAVCRRRGQACPRLWLDVLWWPPPARCLPELLNVIANEKLLSPILVIDCLASTPTYTLGDVRKYLMNVLKSENDIITREQELATKYKSESEKMKTQIQMLQNEPVTFQSSRCAACNRPLELPSVHFLCQHSFHQHCFQSYSESDAECPACVGARRSSKPPPHAAEMLHARLHQEHDPYAVVSEYFGRGLFNKLTVVTSEAVSEPPLPAQAPTPAPTPAAAPPAQTYGPGAEAKLRLQEGQSKQVYLTNTTKQAIAKGTPITPVPEGRMRLLEQQQRYSSSLEANLNKLEPRVHTIAKQSPLASPMPSRDIEESTSSGASPKISSAISNSKNPFEEETYDESKNPFADDEGSNPTNPFGDDADYDKNLNPFS
ncbi:vacuolar protein sorting-associated protein 11 homolog [Hyposmocoma kahamanoa]|uniref:vacuolar protein sorting-associated protein 11 homolog n=1 Tax=Hyposmocoma kahamanoa TaxID=1477025 RepID=UPI000E6D6F59|nr:vacuolar protein sorting-associated protein 11 homolog [Hyposmocoma kahamanoa]